MPKTMIDLPMNKSFILPVHDLNSLFEDQQTYFYERFVFLKEKQEISL